MFICCILDTQRFGYLELCKEKKMITQLIKLHIARPQSSNKAITISLIWIVSERTKKFKD